MQQDIFSAGTAPGSPTTENEIKTLICYLLTKTQRSLTFEQLHEALREHHLVNYFELISAVDSLVESNHIEKNKQDQINFYTVTDLGRATAETLDTSLPYSVREKAVEAVDTILSRQKRREEVKTEISTLENGGYQVELSIPEGNTHLVSFTIYAPTLEEAKRLEKGFLNDPVFIYQGVQSLLSGDLSVLGDLRPTTNPLF